MRRVLGHCLPGCGRVEYRIKRLLILATLVVASSVASSWAVVVSDRLAPLEEKNVMVLVKTYDGWGVQNISTGLSCDGRLQLLGVYADSTRVIASVAPDSALVIVNELLALSFFEQPEEFDSTQRELVSDGQGRLRYLTRTAHDAGYAEITLRVGARSRTVTLRYPATGAAEGLHRWLQRFKTFVDETVKN